MKIEEMKKEKIGFTNTPVEYLPALTKMLGSGKLYIKRDDMTGLALGGNKIRKLEYLVAYAKENGYGALMTNGGVQTNHGRLTVAAAVKFGMKPILLLRGKKPEYMSGNVLLDRLMGADMYFLDMEEAVGRLPEEERAAAKKKFLEQCEKQVIDAYAEKGIKVFNIPVGGSNVIGAAGYIMAVKEIMDQIRDQQLDVKTLVAGYGSTGTYAGLVAGAAYFKAPFEIIGIPIEPEYEPAEKTADFLNEISKAYDMGIHFSEKDIHLETGDSTDPYGGIGYNEPDIVTQSYIELLAKTEGCFLDPCYTGKVMHGFVDLVKKGVIAKDGGAMMLHSGGVPGLWTKEHLDSMQKTCWSDEEKDSVHILKMD